MVKDVSKLSKSELIETIERLQADRAELESELIQNTDLRQIMTKDKITK